MIGLGDMRRDKAAKPWALFKISCCSVARPVIRACCHLCGDDKEGRKKKKGTDRRFEICACAKDGALASDDETPQGGLVVEPGEDLCELTGEGGRDCVSHLGAVEGKEEDMGGGERQEESRRVGRTLAFGRRLRRRRHVVCPDGCRPKTCRLQPE